MNNLYGDSNRHDGSISPDSRKTALDWGKQHEEDRGLVDETLSHIAELERGASGFLAARQKMRAQVALEAQRAGLDVTPDIG